ENDMLTDMKRAEYVDLTISLLSGKDLSDNDFLMLPGETNNDNYYDEYRPHYADINEMILDMFYYEGA
nr:LytR family transcriptional regulator [Lachnospiraceae bacterium]